MITSTVDEVMYGLWMRCPNARCRWLGRSEDLVRIERDGRVIYACPKCRNKNVCEHREELPWHRWRCQRCGREAPYGKVCKECAKKESGSG